MKYLLSVLDRAVAELKREYPDCREAIDRGVASVCKDDREHERGESVHVLAAQLRNYIQKLPCAKDPAIKASKRSLKGTRPGRSRTR